VEIDAGTSVCYVPVTPTGSPVPTLALALIPRAVAINLALGAVVAALKLPIFLDSVGTILVAALAGPWAGVVTGAISTLVLGILSSPTFFAFLPVAAVVGALAGGAARVGAFRSPGWAAAAGVVIGVAAGVASVPIVLALFGGATVSGTGLCTVALRTLGLPLAASTGACSLASDVVDKALSCALVALVIARLPRRLSARFGAA
jgi:energy-coupling factor transport system substrate-specific component